MKIRNEDLNYTLRDLIAKSPFTYKQLEELSGVPFRFIYRFKIGDINELRMSHTLKLCKALGVSVTFSIPKPSQHVFRMPLQSRQGHEQQTGNGKDEGCQHAT